MVNYLCDYSRVISAMAYVLSYKRPNCFCRSRPEQFISAFQDGFCYEQEYYSRLLKESCMHCLPTTFQALFFWRKKCSAVES